MPSLTIKNIPDDVYKRLKIAAKRHHRSMNREVIACLDSALEPEEPADDHRLRRARELAAKYGTRQFTTDEVVEAVREGRDRRD